MDPGSGETGTCGGDLKKVFVGREHVPITNEQKESVGEHVTIATGVTDLAYREYIHVAFSGSRAYRIKDVPASGWSAISHGRDCVRLCMLNVMSTEEDQPLSLFSGDKLCSVEDCIPGTGVYLRHGYIYSSLAGYVLKKNEGEEVRGVSQRHSQGVTKLCCCVSPVLSLHCFFLCSYQ